MARTIQRFYSWRHPFGKSLSFTLDVSPRECRAIARGTYCCLILLWVEIQRILLSVGDTLAIIVPEDGEIHISCMACTRAHACCAGTNPFTSICMGFGCGEFKGLVRHVR